MNHTAVGPKLRARVLALHKDGCPGGVDYDNGRTMVPLRGARNLRAIEAQLAIDGTPISRETVRTVIKAAQARGWDGGEAVEGAGEGSRTVQVRGRGAPMGGARGARGEEPEGEDEGGAIDAPLPVLPEDASVAARLVYAELVDVRAAARGVYAQVLAGSFPMNQWVAAKTHSLRLMKALAELLPPPRPDPAKDPTNISAREMTHGHVLRTIRQAQARMGKLCPACRAGVQERYL